MIIIGGIGSVMGSYFGAAFITLLPIFLNFIHFLAVALSITISSAVTSVLQLLIFGALIIFFLIVEPHGLARLWSILKEKLRLWPFPIKLNYVIKLLKGTMMRKLSFLSFIFYLFLNHLYAEDSQFLE